MTEKHEGKKWQEKKHFDFRSVLKVETENGSEQNTSVLWQ